MNLEDRVIWVRESDLGQAVRDGPDSPVLEPGSGQTLQGGGRG